MDFKSLFDHFSKMLDKVSLIDLLQYLEANSAIARFTYENVDSKKLANFENQKLLWDDEIELEPPKKKKPENTKKQPSAKSSRKKSKNQKI